jgi:hypothetical protein
MQLVLVDAAAPRLPDRIVAKLAPAARTNRESVRVAVSSRTDIVIVTSTQPGGNGRKIGLEF